MLMVAMNTPPTSRRDQTPSAPGSSDPAAAKSSVIPVPALRILAIDDEEQIRTTLKLMLEHLGHSVELAVDGEHGLALASQQPDLVLCDINMPNLNGYAVLESIRGKPGCAETPFIFLTGLDDRKSMRHGMNLGADDYLTKPFSFEDLEAAISASYWKHATVRQRLRELVDARRSEESAPWAHELLTPIHGVLGFATMLEEESETISREELRWMAAGIRKSGERQLALARKILRHYELDRLLEEGVRPRRETGATQALAEAATRAAAAADRALDVLVSCAPASVAVPALYLETIGVELVENACKFSAKGSSVVVHGAVAGLVYRFEVRDAGIGMKAEEREAIAPFRQFGREEREQQGLGLGLANVRAITRLCGGALRLSAGAGGAGLHATVELPLAASA